MFFVAGGHWTVLQTVAWAEMLHGYSQRTGSLTVAVEQTFDGRHPCALCRGIEAAKSKEHKGGPVLPGAKADAKVKAPVSDPSLLPAVRVAVTERIFPAVIVAVAISRDDAPPTPPPQRGQSAA